jgi:hypothetical protein
MEASMTSEAYYKMLLESARKNHSAHVRQSRKWQFCLREACLREARGERYAAHRYIAKIREARANAN